MQPTVNRYLKDKAMDHIDHALGRPAWPLVETYRNYFSCEDDSPEAIAFRSSPFWWTSRAGKHPCFCVTRQGRKALADHLAELDKPTRVFAVTYLGYETLVAAPTAGKAKYSHFLNISDALSDLTFFDFCKTARVRIEHQPKETTND